VTVGAVRFSAGGKGEASSGAAVMGAGAGGRGSAEEETIRIDGDLAACEGAEDEAPAPPRNCSAMVRVEVAKLEAKPTAPPTAPVGNDERCGTGLTSEGCHQGETRKIGGKCLRIRGECPPGTYFEFDQGCVPNHSDHEFGPSPVTGYAPWVNVRTTGSADYKWSKLVDEKARAAVQCCFWQALVSNPSFSAGLILTCSVDAQGNATDVHLGNGRLPSKSAAYDACVIDALRNFRFPAPSSPTQAEVEVEAQIMELNDRH
jgi:hypothetical protein